MLVKKLHPEWQPSEDPGLGVGETIDITDPRQLILGGMAIALGEDGEELDAFDLYGVVDKTLVDELKAFKAAKHQDQIKEELEKEHAVLEKELKKIKSENKKKYRITELDSMAWKKLRQLAIDEGVFSPKAKKPELIEALVAKLG